MGRDYADPPAGRSPFLAGGRRTFTQLPPRYSAGGADYLQGFCFTTYGRFGNPAKVCQLNGHRSKPQFVTQALSYRP